MIQQSVGNKQTAQTNMSTVHHFVPFLYSSSSSSSPDTSAFSWPAFAMSCARSCSSVSETALGCVRES